MNIFSATVRSLSLLPEQEASTFRVHHAPRPSLIFEKEFSGVKMDILQVRATLLIHKKIKEIEI